MSNATRLQQLASVYRTDDRLIVHSQDRTTSGVWVAGTFVVGMVIDVPESELGAAVLMALAGSRADQPHPKNLTEVGRLVLDAAGKRTWRALERSAVLVQVRRDGVVIRVVPTRNGGTAGDDRGFHELADRASVLEHDAPSTEIARAVLAAFSSCY